jgi:hypothetical protein
VILTIQPSYEEIPSGSYKTSFVEIAELETSKGKAFRWVFKSEDGKIISGLSDAEHAPSPKNKTGRWIAALSGKPLTTGLAVNPKDYAGKKYLCIVAAGENGTRLETFVQM